MRSSKVPILRVVTLALLAMITVGAGMLALRVARADVAATIYRQRLAALTDDYESLRGDFNALVKRSAVTELHVRDGELSVRVRSAAGVLREIPTPYDPTSEIYVDYVVLDGRIWIRRLFDATTPPWMGLVIEPELVAVEWEEDSTIYGKAVYRRLSEGRWVVTVTGGGALGLARVEHDGDVELTLPPETLDLDAVESEADEQMNNIGPGEILRRLVLGG